MKYVKTSSNFPFINEINTSEDLLSDTVVATYSYNTKDYAYFSLLTFIFTNIKIKSIFLNKDRATVISFVKNHSDLDTTLDAIEIAILNCNLVLLRNAATKFAKKILIDNKNYFSKDEIIKLISGE